MSGQTAGSPILSSIKRTCERLDLGRTTVYKLIEEKRLEVVKIGTKTLVTETSIQRLADPQGVAA